MATVSIRYMVTGVDAVIDFGLFEPGRDAARPATGS